MMLMHMSIAVFAGQVAMTDAIHSAQPQSAVPLQSLDRQHAEVETEIRPLMDSSLETDELALAAFSQQPAFGTKGTRRFQIHGGYALDPTETDNSLGLVGIGVSYFFLDNVSIDAELNGIYVMQKGADAYAGNINILFRWHFISEPTWTMYGDVGAGLFFANNHVPSTGSKFNFTPQAGLGFSFDLGNDTRLMTGVRWLHISNARLYSNNPGREHVYAYAGLNFGF